MTDKPKIHYTRFSVTLRTCCGLVVYVADLIVTDLVRTGKLV